MQALRGIAPARLIVPGVLLAALLFAIWAALPEATFVALLVVAVCAEALLYGALFVIESRRHG